MKITLSPSKLRLLLYWLAILAGVVLLPRVLPFPATFLTFDEITIGRWTSQMNQALLTGDWSNTANNAYPAVSLMWIEALQLQLLKLIPGMAVDVTRTLAELDSALFVALPRQRFTLALINSLIIFAIGVMLSRLYHNRVVITAILLMALDPFLLTQSRVFRVEGVTTGLMMLSALITLVYAQKRHKGWLIASAILAGWAILAKMTSLFLLPFTGLAWLAWPWLAGQKIRPSFLKGLVLDILLWSLLVGLTCFVLWPALWIAPLTTFNQMYQYVQRAASDTGTIWGEGGYFFFQGQLMRTDPGLAFYLWSLAYRTTPLVWLGLLLLGLGVGLGWFKNKLFPRNDASAVRSPATWLLAAYIICYFVAMNLGTSKADRYLLPIFPGLSILAAVGFAFAIEMVGRLASGSGRLSFIQHPAMVWALWGGVLVGGLALTLPYHPYYFNYWNPLLGGGQAAAKILPVGSGEGVDRLLSYLNHLPNALHTKLTGSGTIVTQTCVFVFIGTCLEETDLLASDYYIAYIFDLQRRATLNSRVKTILSEAELIQRYTHNGLDYAQLYKMPNYLYVTNQWMGEYGRFRGYRLSAPEVGAGNPLTVTIYWENGEQPGWQLADSEFFVNLLDETDQIYQSQVAQLKNEFQPYLSQPAEMLLFTAPFTLPLNTSPGVYSIEIGLRLKATGEETWNFSLGNLLHTVTVNRGALNVSTAALPIEQHLNQPIGATGLTLLGYTPVIESQPPRLDLYWKANKPPTQNYLLHLALLDKAKQPIATWSNYLSPPIHPLTSWQPGEIVKIPFPLDLGYPLPSEPACYILSVLPDNSLPESPPVARVELPDCSDKLFPIRPHLALSYQRYAATFGQNLDLLGYDLIAKKNAGGGLLFVTLSWLNRQPLQALEAEIQVLDQTGQVIGQQLLPVPNPPSYLTWQSISHYQIPLTNVPSALTIKVRPTGLDHWLTIYPPNQPSTEQIFIDRIWEKARVVLN